MIAYILISIATLHYPISPFLSLSLSLSLYETYEIIREFFTVLAERSDEYEIIKKEKGEAFSIQSENKGCQNYYYSSTKEA